MHFSFTTRPLSKRILGPHFPCHLSRIFRFFLTGAVCGAGIENRFRVFPCKGIVCLVSLYQNALGPVFDGYDTRLVLLPILTGELILPS